MLKENQKSLEDNIVSMKKEERLRASRQKKELK